jgi:hypothetical protein
MLLELVSMTTTMTMGRANQRTTHMNLCSADA